MPTVIAKNSHTANVEIEDLGIIVDLSSQVTLTEFFSFVEVCESKDLKVEVNAGRITINDGTDDLSAANGVKHITLKSQYEDEVQDELIPQNIDGGVASSVYLVVQNLDGGNA